MLRDFNLVVSTSRGNETNTCSEMWYLLGEVGDRSSTVDKTSITGLVVAKTKLDPVKAVHDLRALLHERPWEFKYTLKLVPVQKVVQAEINGVKEEALNLASGIGESERFRITVEKRRTQLSSKEIIDAIAKGVDRTVDLEHPDRIVMVEIIGELAGVSLLTANDILSVEREKRSG